MKSGLRIVIFPRYLCPSLIIVGAPRELLHPPMGRLHLACLRGIPRPAAPVYQRPARLNRSARPAPNVLHCNCQTTIMRQC